MDGRLALDEPGVDQNERRSERGVVAPQSLTCGGRPESPERALCPSGHNRTPLGADATGHVEIVQASGLEAVAARLVPWPGCGGRRAA